jgi:WD40 repeat protein
MGREYKTKIELKTKINLWGFGCSVFVLYSYHTANLSTFLTPCVTRKSYFSGPYFFRVPQVQIICSPLLLSLALYIGLALSSCSLLDPIVTEPLNPNTTNKETKQAKDGSSSVAKNYLSPSYLRSALTSKAIEKAPEKFLKIIKIDNKYKDMYGFEALALTTSGGLLLIHSDGLMVPIPLAKYQLQAVAYCPLNEMVAFAETGIVHLVDLKTGQEIASLKKIRARISSIDFDASCDGVLIGATDSKVYRWRYKNEQEGRSLSDKEQALERYVGHTSVISQVKFHPKGRVFFSADWQGKVLAWVRYDADGFEGQYLTNAVTGRPFTVEGQLAKASFQADGSVETLRVNQSGELLAISSDKGQLALLMVRGFRMLAKIQAHNGLIYDLDYSADGKTVVTVGRDNRLKVWRVVDLDLDSIDPTEASLQLVYEMPLAGAYKVAIVDHDRVVVGLTDGTVKFVSINPALPVAGGELPLESEREL